MNIEKYNIEGGNKEETLKPKEDITLNHISIKPKVESSEEKNVKINKVKEEINKYFSLLKKATAIAAVGVVGFMPIKSEGQTNSENNIENQDSLKTEIFNEVRNAYDNGVMKELGKGSYFYCFDRENFSVWYNLDTNYDGKHNENDKDPEIEISYKEGNSNYSLRKKSKLESDLVYNYKDNSLDNATTKTYAEFFSENSQVIPELYGKNNTPVNFREINIKEKKELLEKIRGIVLEEKASQIEISELSHNLIDKIKSSFPEENFENQETRKIMKFGPYNFEFNKNIFTINFTNKEGFENEISFDMNGSVVNLLDTKKTTPNENISLSGMEVEEILKIIISHM